ncbi:uncharacterized protein LOC128671410 [Plodia interpunctella]|uniref:uncharacterized protein LOC128671410 n=1 Tax=Plodia interpunctella TaxID=58824 RepID=UPI0023684EB7|nr:uncharacterized protein LOC128671410 [Plodia interpunctella]
MKPIACLLFLLLSTVYGAKIGFRDYHKEIGIPLAKKLMKLETEIIAKYGLSGGRIAGGSFIDIAETPYQAAVVIETPELNHLSLCGGALISSTRVLTAAHCQLRQAIYTIGLGSNFAFHGGVRAPATVFIPHPGYIHGAWSLIHDIAMIHIESVQFSTVIQPVSLPNQEELANNFAGQPALISGFGITPKVPTLTMNQVLSAVDVQVITPAECGQSYGTIGSRDETLCTGGAGNVGACSSDSGGPLTVVSNNRRILVGIVSFGGGCGSESPTGFVRVNQYYSWILSNFCSQSLAVYLIKMKAILAFFLVLSTVYSANIGFRDYHNEIGIPFAKKLKQFEHGVITKMGDELSIHRIGGGSLTDISKIPHQAGVVIELSPSSVSCCGGILISSTRVLTAAHCQFDNASYVVALGSNFVFYGGLRVNVTDFIPHPEYVPEDTTHIHDIAMLHIPAVSFTNTIQPISLPNTDEASCDFAGMMAVISGYGVTPEAPSLHWNQVLKAVEAQVITPAQCGALYGTTGSRDESICTSGTGGVGICVGDSGGPLTVESNNRRILIGLSSFGAGCGSVFPSGYVRITQYLSWILST